MWAAWHKACEREGEKRGGVVVGCTVGTRVRGIGEGENGRQREASLGALEMLGNDGTERTIASVRVVGKTVTNNDAPGRGWKEEVEQQQQQQQRV